MNGGGECDGLCVNLGRLGVGARTDEPCLFSIWCGRRLGPMPMDDEDCKRCVQSDRESNLQCCNSSSK